MAVGYGTVWLCGSWLCDCVAVLLCYFVVVWCFARGIVRPRVGIFDIDEFFVIEDDSVTVVDLLSRYLDAPAGAVAFSRLV